MRDTESYQELKSVIEQVLSAATDDFSQLATRAKLALGNDLAGANLKGVDLSGVDLSHADLRGTDLRGAILQGTNLLDAKVEQALFGNNLGLSEAEKLELEKRGAVFEELPEPNLPWLTHLQKLSLPVPIPDGILAQLLDQCQEVAQSSSLIGVKLVSAVEGLFPDQSQIINELAPIVLLGSSRSSEVNSQIQAHFPSSYDAATPVGKVALLSLAAKQIIDALSLDLSPQQPIVERQWQTSAGWLTLQAEYRANQELQLLRVMVQLPCGGSLQLQGNGEQKVAQSAEADCLTVELLNPYPEQIYTLAVSFSDTVQKPLVFTLRITN